jgi:hypothetical protein
MTWDSQRSLQLPKEVRDALDDLGSEAPPDEREFSARLHRRLAEAGAPPAPSWLERFQGWVSDLWQDASQKRTLATGAVLGALATATAFLLLTGGHPFRDGGPAVSPDDDTAADVDPGVGPSEHKALRAVGDRRIMRDRLGEDIGAERPERPRVPTVRSR